MATREELLANPPHNAEKPLTFLESRDEKVPEMRLIDRFGTLWAVLAGNDTVWGSWLKAEGVWYRSWFSNADWTEVEV